MAAAMIQVDKVERDADGFLVMHFRKIDAATRRPVGEVFVSSPIVGIDAMSDAHGTVQVGNEAFLAILTESGSVYFAAIDKDMADSIQSLWKECPQLPSVPGPLSKERKTHGRAAASERTEGAIAGDRAEPRRAVCVLSLVDVGKADREIARLQADRFVIGRTEGDLLLPHDEHISTRHLEVAREVVDGQERWVVADLQSTNGTFLRVRRAVLCDRSEFLVGKGHYRYEEPGREPTPPANPRDSAPGPKKTVAFAHSVPANVHPALVEIVGASMASRALLSDAEYWIGSHPDCAICRPHDPLLEAKHVRLFRDARGAWIAQTNKSPGGLWIRIPQVTVEDGCLLQIGEQRIRLKVER